MKKLFMLCFLSFIFIEVFAWGFWAHKRINRLAVFTLPPEMIAFYKENIEYITEHAVDPDKRRYAVEGEAPKHFIDLDYYCTYPCDSFPRQWYQAKEKYSEDTLMEYGIVPWAIELTMKSLTNAFEQNDKARILKYSADLGHYIADSHVPLHTTLNYNGQLSNQHGIHGLWESRLPELFNNEYDFFVGRARYIENTNEFIWDNILLAHSHLEKVLSYEKGIDNTFPSDQKYSFETRGATIVRTYSEGYSNAYHQKLNGMVEEQMRQSIKHIGDLWFTCWVNAGMPNLYKAEADINWRDEDKVQLKENAGKIKSRSHSETGFENIEEE